MFITENLIYLQLQKTGSTHIARLLDSHIGGSQIGLHNRLNDSFTNKYIVGSVRNPWDWYVSLWSFGCAQKGGFFNRQTYPKLITRFNLGRPPRKIGVTLHYLLQSMISIFHNFIKPVNLWKSTYGDVNDQDQFRKWLHLVFEPKRKYDLDEGYAFSPLCEFAGFYTYRYVKLYSKDLKPIYDPKYLSSYEKLKRFDQENNILDAVIHTENLEYDLLRVLLKSGYYLSSEQQDAILTRKNDKTNISKHQATSFYYDDETIDLVRLKDQLIIDKYNYKFPTKA